MHITPQEPSRDSGGGLGVLQTSMSLCTENNQVTYIGPRINDLSIAKMYEKTIFLERDHNVVRRAIALVRGISSSLFYEWKKLRIDFSEFDYCVMDFTKLDFVLSRELCCPLIVKAHNVEFDYSNNDFRKNKKINKWVVSKLAYRQENKILKCAQYIFALTDNDKDRFISLYGDSLKDKILLNPVAIEEKEVKIKEKHSPLRLLVTGSLWYGENANGIMWFIDNVLSKMGNSLYLTIAGAKPNDELISKVEKCSNARIVASPDVMDEYFYDADVVVAPVFNGAGMKVKVAEALAYRKVLIGTNHAIVGYKVIDGKNAYIANTGDEFIEKIDSVIRMNEANYQEICTNAFMLFEDMHSINCSREQWRKVMVNK